MPLQQAQRMLFGVGCCSCVGCGSTDGSVDSIACRPAPRRPVQHDQRILNGVHRVRHEFILRAVTARYGTGPPVFEALSERMHVSAAALEARAAALAAAAARLAEEQRETRWADKQRRESV